MEETTLDVLSSVRKKAIGYVAEESVSEYVVSDGELQLQKRKVTQKEVPPDMTAAKMLLELHSADPYEAMSETELEQEKNRLLEILKEKNNETN